MTPGALRRSRTTAISVAGDTVSDPNGWPGSAATAHRQHSLAIDVREEVRGAGKSSTPGNGGNRMIELLAPHGGRFSTGPGRHGGYKVHAELRRAVAS
jgi:hypothetical protein